MKRACGVACAVLLVLLAACASGEMLYWDAAGERYYHADLYCGSREGPAREALPEGEASLSLAPYDLLLPCPVCMPGMQGGNAEAQLLYAAYPLPGGYVAKLRWSGVDVQMYLRLYLEGRLLWDRPAGNELSVNMHADTLGMTGDGQVAFLSQVSETETEVLLHNPEDGAVQAILKPASGHVLPTPQGMLIYRQEPESSLSLVDWDGKQAWRQQPTGLHAPAAAVFVGDACYLSYETDAYMEAARHGVACVAADGSVRWQRLLPERFDWAQHIAAGEAGILVAGYSRVRADAANVALLDYDGNLLWWLALKRGKGIVHIYSVEADETGFTLLGTMTRGKYSFGEMRQLDEEDCYRMRIDAAGEVLSQEAWTFAGTAYAERIGHAVGIYPQGEDWVLEGYLYGDSPYEWMGPVYATPERMAEGTELLDIRTW